ncbi:MAG: hypothetical protein RL409_1543 [Gemmatimonadota bacterium]|jgi:hypothetical protein
MPSPSPAPENAPDANSPPTGAASLAAVPATVTVPVRGYLSAFVMRLSSTRCRTAGSGRAWDRISLKRPTARHAGSRASP